MKKLKNLWQQFYHDESAQGATEYILLLVVVVAIAIIFKDKIKQVLSDKISDLGGKIQGFDEN